MMRRTVGLGVHISGNHGTAEALGVVGDKPGDETTTNPMLGKTEAGTS